VDRYGFSRQIDLVAVSGILASTVWRIQNMLEAERIATNLRGEQN